jgi:hypothetical protein
MLRSIKKCKNIIGILCLTIVAFSVILSGLLISKKACADMEQIVLYNELTLGGKLVDGTEFKLLISIAPCSENNFPVSGKFWGVDSVKPEHIIKSLSLIINNKEILIPKNAIADLADVNLPYGVYLMQNSNAIILYLKGGDAAGAYTAALKVHGGRVVARTINFVNNEGELGQVISEYNDGGKSTYKPKR